MGDIWKKARPGQRLEIPAAAYNAWVDAARAERNRQHDVAQDAGLENRQTTVAKVKNTSGADLDRFAVLALSGSDHHADGQPPGVQEPAQLHRRRSVRSDQVQDLLHPARAAEERRHRPRDRRRHHAGQGERDPGGRSVR